MFLKSCTTRWEYTFGAVGKEECAVGLRAVVERSLRKALFLSLEEVIHRSNWAFLIVSYRSDHSVSVRNVFCLSKSCNLQGTLQPPHLESEQPLLWATMVAAPPVPNSPYSSWYQGAEQWWLQEAGVLVQPHGIVYHSTGRWWVMLWESLDRSVAMALGRTPGDSNTRDEASYQYGWF